MKRRNFFIILAVAGLLVFGGIVLFGQDKAVPTYPESSKVKILQIQLKQTNLRAEYIQIQARMKEIEAQFPRTLEELQDAQDEAYKLAKVDKKEFTIDLQKLEFVAMPKPPEKTEEKK
jgi:proteasome assembly chaperone (PAC2) family protein